MSRQASSAVRFLCLRGILASQQSVLQEPLQLHPRWMDFARSHFGQLSRTPSVIGDVKHHVPEERAQVET